MLDFRTSGKPLYAYLEYAGDRDYFLASAADKVFLMPSTPLDLKGVVTYELFLRGSLDKLGVYPDLHHIGDYKTAPNTFTEKTFTKAHKEMDESLNRDLYDRIVEDVASGRKKSADDVRRADRRWAVSAGAGGGARSRGRSGVRGSGHRKAARRGRWQSDARHRRRRIRAASARARSASIEGRASR